MWPPRTKNKNDINMADAKAYFSLIVIFISKVGKAKGIIKQKKYGEIFVKLSANPDETMNNPLKIIAENEITMQNNKTSLPFINLFFKSSIKSW